MLRSKSSGFAPPIVPIVIILGIIVFVLFSKELPRFYPIKTTVPAPSVTASPVPTVTMAPKVSQTPKPTVVPTPKATASPVSGPPGAGYSTITVATEKGNFTASVLSIDLNNAKMITDTGNDSDCGSGCTAMSLADYVNRNSGFAGINGTYFCPSEPAYSYCGGANNYDFPVWNTKLGRWINGGNLFWDSRAIFYFDGGGAHYLQNANGFSGNVSAAIVNFPGLVSDGNVQIDDNQSGLSDKQKAVGTKVGIGLRDPNNIMLVIGRNVSMQQFAYVFKALGAKGALNLDDGGSVALYYNGKYLAGPGRALPNAVVFAK